MTYQCNDSSCRPCKHVELNVLCSHCLQHKLIIAPHGEWVYCPDWHGCGWEMSYKAFLEADIDGERQTTIQRKVEQYKAEIVAKQAQITELEAMITAIEAKQ